jgi:hypothetical protein
MNKPPSQALFALVEAFFTGYLPRQRGASVHTIRAYRDSLKLLFEFHRATPSSRCRIPRRCRFGRRSDYSFP